LTEEKKQNQNEEQKPDEVIEETAYISGEYLSCACGMVAWQYIDSTDPDPTPEEFMEQCARHLRQHAPVAYSYFFQNHHGDAPLPSGTVDVIRDHVRMHKPSFMGGDARGRIFIPN
jgi:hypothetical protein